MRENDGATVSAGARAMLLTGPATVSLSWSCGAILSHAGRQYHWPTPLGPRGTKLDIRAVAVPSPRECPEGLSRLRFGTVVLCEA